MPNRQYVCFHVSNTGRLFQRFRGQGHAGCLNTYSGYYSIILTSAFQRTFRIIILVNCASSRARRGAGVRVRRSCFV